MTRPNQRRKLGDIHRQIKELQDQIQRVKTAKPISGCRNEQDGKDAAEQLNRLQLELDLLDWEKCDSDLRRAECSQLNKKSKELQEQNEPIGNKFPACKTT